jgi:hypothetical protein
MCGLCDGAHSFPVANQGYSLLCLWHVSLPTGRLLYMHVMHQQKKMRDAVRVASMHCCLDMHGVRARAQALETFFVRVSAMPWLPNAAGPCPLRFSLSALSAVS